MPEATCTLLPAGPVGTTGFCDGQCCTGTCSYDSMDETWFCCARLGYRLQSPDLPVVPSGTFWDRSGLRSFEDEPSGCCAGPPGSAGRCSGECCSAATDVCVSNRDDGDESCCAPHLSPTCSCRHSDGCLAQKTLTQHLLHNLGVHGSGTYIAIDPSDR